MPKRRKIKIKKVKQAVKKKEKKYYFFQRYLDDGERILYVAHKHVLVLKIDSAKTIFFGICIPVFMYFLFPEVFIFWVIWVFIGIVAWVHDYVDWYFDAWILTNVGVIDVERGGFFDFTSTRLDYHMIEGISYSINGFWRTVLNYGDIVVDKLGSQTSVSLKDAANPKKLERILIAYQDKYVSSRSVRDHNALKDMLSEMIAYHVQSGKVDVE